MNARLSAVLALSACIAAGCSNQQHQLLPLDAVPGTNAVGPATSSSRDEWTTYAFNEKRTGFNGAVKTMTTANVGKLTLRWKVSIGTSTIAASPVVYAGNMIVVTFGSKGRGPTAAVYD